MSVRVIAPAKVNLFLGVGPPRADGYHGVSTILQAVNHSDTVTLDEADELLVVCEPPVGIPAEDNLAHRAASALAEALSRPAQASIHVRKAVPTGAGLGGGSSDAAAVLAGLAALWGLDREDPMLARVAASLGADVPFFLGEGGGTALFGDRGDRFERAFPTPVLDLVLAKPRGSISTAAAYAAFDAAPAPAGRLEAMLEALTTGDRHAIASALSNNLANAACGLVAAVGDALAWMRTADGVLGTSVSGSGSGVFAVCEDARSARRIAESASKRGLWSVATTSRDSAVTVGQEPRGR